MKNWCLMHYRRICGKNLKTGNLRLIIALIMRKQRPHHHVKPYVKPIIENIKSQL